MENLNQIIKESLAKIREKHLILTPENYTEIFNEISKKYGYSSNEDTKLQKFISRLPLDYKYLANNVKNLDELVAFLTAKLFNKDDSDLNSSFEKLCKRIFQTISILKTKELNEISKKGIEILNSKYNTADLDKLRQYFFEFISNYDDNFLFEFKKYGVKNFDDIKEALNELKCFLNNNSFDCSRIVNLLSYALRPSIATSLNEELDRINEQLSTNPGILNNDKVYDSLRDFIDRRIKLDKGEISKNLNHIGEILHSIDEKISQNIDVSKDSSLKMQKIKNELQNVDLDKGNLKEIKNNLFNIAQNLEEENNKFGIRSNENQIAIKALEGKIALLEKELNSVKIEASEDYLTKTANKRALINEIDKFDESYKRYGTDFCLCFLDIDFFKKINDKYGHEAGDAILSTIAQIFKRYSRRIDFVGRYGGEEFIILLPNTSLENAIILADKLRKIVENFNFIYKKERISVTLSCGVSMRSMHNDKQCTIENADKMLYEAKQQGRNMVMPKIKF